MTDAPDTLERLLQQSCQLYSLPGVAIQVLELTNNPQVDAGQLKTCIECDPALTAKVLKVVNSSLFGLSRRVSDLNQTLALLGAKPLKLLVLGFSLPEPLFANIAGDVLNQYWKHTLTRAVAAREISERVWKLPGDEVFIVGLLKDLGRLVLIQGLGQPYAEFLRKATASGCALRTLERRSLGFDHVQLTAGVLTHWGLPASLIESIAGPDARSEIDSLPPSSQATPQVLYLAELVAQLLAEEQTDVLPEILSAGQRDHKLSEQQLSALTAGIEETVSQLADVLSLELSGGLVYSEVLARAYQQLSLAAAEAAGDLVAARSETLAARLDSLMLSEEVKTLSTAAANFSVTRRDAAETSAPKRIEPEAARQTTPSQAPRTAVAEPKRAAPSRPAKSSTVTAEWTGEIDPGLLGRLTVAATACRRARCDLSLLLIELDRFEELVFSLGVGGANEAWRRLEEACRSLEHPGANWLQVSEGRLALILPDCDRRAAVEAGNELLRQMRDGSGGSTEFVPTVSVAACTVAMPPRNFAPQALAQRAERCLYAAQVAGGNCLKSIEIYY